MVHRLMWCCGSNLRLRRRVVSYITSLVSSPASTFIFKTGLPLNLELIDAARVEAMPRNLLSPAPQHLVFFVGARDWTQVLVLVQWTLYNWAAPQPQEGLFKRQLEGIQKLTGTNIKIQVPHYSTHFCLFLRYPDYWKPFIQSLAIEQERCLVQGWE